MPNPNTGEHQGEFLKRCMGDAEANRSFPNMSQRYAFCNSQWNNKKTVMNNFSKYKDYVTTFDIKDVDGKKGVVTGYFANFNSVDSDGDIIKPGAFSKTIKEWGPGSTQPRIKHLLNHNPQQPLGVLQTLKEDAAGLLYQSHLGTHELGQDFIKMADSGLITEHSIGYKTIKYSQLKPYEEYQGKDGEAIRELQELKLYEGSSLTAWGANSNTPLLSVKSGDLVKRNELIEKFCRNSTASDATIEFLLKYNKELVQAIENSKADNNTEPVMVCPNCGNEMSYGDAVASDMTCSDCGKSMMGMKATQATEPNDLSTQREPDNNSENTLPEVKPFVASTCECPNCKKLNYTTAKGYIKCTGCKKIFVPGTKSSLFI
jgi:HK97 family phage prohead protease